MPSENPLYDEVAADTVPAGLPLVVLMTGFTDAGSAVSQLVEWARERLPFTVLRRYRNDALLDYRARRPIVEFDQDHLTGYSPPRLEIARTEDSAGQPFLLLAGYEPDFAWESFTASVQQFVVAAGVSSVTWVHAIGMPVPHTRPIGATVSGNRPELSAARSVWRPRTQVPATAAHVLEYRLAQDDVPVSGFVLLVPHYLGDAEYPAAAIAGLDTISAGTGLSFDVGTLRSENEEFLLKVGEQIAGSDELSRMLTALEQRYDAYMAAANPAEPLLHEGDLPSADELAAELERYLATRPNPDGDGYGPGRP
jgi:hypothetical protein